MSQPANEQPAQLNSTVQNVSSVENPHLNMTTVSSIQAPIPHPNSPPSQSLPDSQFSTVLQNVAEESEFSQDSYTQEIVQRQDFTLHMSSLNNFLDTPLPSPPSGASNDQTPIATIEGPISHPAPKESIGSLGSKDSGHSSTCQDTTMSQISTQNLKSCFKDGMWHCAICPDQEFQREVGLKAHMRANKCSAQGTQKISAKKKAT